VVSIGVKEWDGSSVYNTKLRQPLLETRQAGEEAQAVKAL